MLSRRILLYPVIAALALAPDSTSEAAALMQRAGKARSRFRPHDASFVALQNSQQALRARLNRADQSALRSPAPTTPETGFDLARNALLSALRPPGEHAIRWGTRGQQRARLSLYHEAMASRFLPAGWVQAPNASYTPPSLTMPHIASSPKKATQSQVGNNTETHKHNEAIDGFEFAANRLDTRSSEYNGVNGLNRRITGAWQEYWTETRDRARLQTDFAEWAKAAKANEVIWVRKLYPEEIKNRITRNTENVQKFKRKITPSRLSGARVEAEASAHAPELKMLQQAEREQRLRTSEITYKNRRIPAEAVLKATHGLSESSARNLAAFERVVAHQYAMKYKTRGFGASDSVPGLEDKDLEIARTVYPDAYQRLPGVTILTTTLPSGQRVREQAGPTAAPRHLLAGGTTPANSHDDAWTPEIPLEFTPPVWRGTTHTRVYKERDVEVLPVKNWDASPIEVSPKVLQQVLEGAVAIQAKPFDGVERSERDYFGKDDYEAPLGARSRPWHRLWRPKRLFDTWFDDVVA